MKTLALIFAFVLSGCAAARQYQPRILVPSRAPSVTAPGTQLALARPGRAQLAALISHQDIPPVPSEFELPRQFALGAVMVQPKNCMNDNLIAVEFKSFLREADAVKFSKARDEAINFHITADCAFEGNALKKVTLRVKNLKSGYESKPESVEDKPLEEAVRIIYKRIFANLIKRDAAMISSRGFGLGFFVVRP